MNGLAALGLFSEEGIFNQLLIQLFGIAVTIAWSGFISYLLFKLIDKSIGIRVSQDAPSELLFLLT